MTTKQAIKKYNLQLIEQDNFAKQYNITTYKSTTENEETKTTYTMTNEFSRVMGDLKDTYYLIIQKWYKNEYVCDRNGQNCRHKGFCRTYKLTEV